jgi:hypothetical protein
MKHRAVILLGVAHQPRILFREEEFISGDTPVATGVVSSATSQLDELLNDFTFTRAA